MTTDSLKDREEKIISEFEMFDDWMDKYEYIIDLGKELEGFPLENKREENLIRGCQSQVWLTSLEREGLIFFQADSDAIITKGLVALMVRALSGSSANEILKADMRFVDAVGLKEHLSPNRSNGLVSMIKQMKMYALAYSKK